MIQLNGLYAKHPILRVFAVGIIGVSLALSGTSWAGNPLGLCGPHQVFSWNLNNGPVPFNIDQHDPTSDFGHLARDAFQVWSNVPKSNLAFQDQGGFPFDVKADNFFALVNADFLGLHPIIQDEGFAIIDMLYGADSGILGFAGAWDIQSDPNCEIVQGFAVMGDEPNLSRNLLFTVLVHEFGHYIGLGHTAVNGELIYKQNAPWAANPGIHLPSGALPMVQPRDVSIMFPYLVNMNSSGLSRDDQSSLISLYPAPGFHNFNAEGTVFDSHQNPLTGVNVIARNVADPLGDAISGLSGIHEPGKFNIPGLRVGETYVFHTSENVSGGSFVTTPIIFGGPEEFYNGFNESNNLITPDNVTDATEFKLYAGLDSLTNLDFIFNIRNTPPEMMGIFLGDYDSSTYVGGEKIKINAQIKNASQVALMVNLSPLAPARFRIPMIPIGNNQYEAMLTFPDHFSSKSGEVEIQVVARSKGRMSANIKRKIQLYDSDAVENLELIGNPGFESGQLNPWNFFQPINGIFDINNVNPIAGSFDVKSTPLDPNLWNACEFYQSIQIPAVTHRAVISWSEKWVAQETQDHYLLIYLFEPQTAQFTILTEEAFELSPGNSDYTFELDIRNALIQNGLEGKQVFLGVYRESIAGITTTQFDNFSMNILTND